MNNQKLYDIDMVLMIMARHPEYFDEYSFDHRVTVNGAFGTYDEYVKLRTSKAIELLDNAHYFLNKEGCGKDYAMEYLKKLIDDSEYTINEISYKSFKELYPTCEHWNYNPKTKTIFVKIPIPKEIIERRTL